MKEINKSIVAVVLLLGLVTVLGCNRKGVVENISPKQSVLEVGETTPLTCTFNKGSEVEWVKSNNNVFFVCGRNEDSKRVVGVKEGSCMISASGRNGSSDVCEVQVKTTIQPKETIQLYVGDTATIFTRSGYRLKAEYNTSYCLLNTESGYEKIRVCDETGHNQMNIEITNVVITNGEVNTELQSIELEGDETLIYTTTNKLVAKKAGETWVRFYDENTLGQMVDTGIFVTFLPTSTFGDCTEPLDFDDTQDSVLMKIGPNYTMEFSEDGDLNWIYYDYDDSDLLMVTYGKENDFDFVSNYALAFSDEDAKTNITDCVNENYILMYEIAGMRVYVDSDFTKMVSLSSQDVNGTEYLFVIYMPYDKSLKEQDVARKHLNRFRDAIVGR